MEHPKAERILDCSFHGSSRDPWRPVAVLCQELVNDAYVQAMRVSRNLVFRENLLRLHSFRSSIPAAAPAAESYSAAFGIGLPKTRVGAAIPQPVPSVTRTVSSHGRRKGPALRLGLLK